MEKLRFRAHEKEKLSHYSKATTDVEYLFPVRLGRARGHRQPHRLRSARSTRSGCARSGKWKGEELQDFQLVEEDAEWSSGKLSYFDDEEKRRYIPYVIEPAAGADRATLAFLCDAYDEDVAGNDEERVVLRLHPRLAPIKAAVLPLVKKDGMPERARTIYDALKKQLAGHVRRLGGDRKALPPAGRGGTPLCITIDGDTLKDGTVTVRERDSMQQSRVSEDAIVRLVEERLEG